MSNWLEGVKKDKVIISWFLVIIMFVSYLVPLGIPLTIRDPTRKTYEFIQSLDDPRPVLLSLDYTAGAQPEIKPGMLAVLKHIIQENIKFVIVGVGTDEATALMQTLLNESGAREQYINGQDYLAIGYIPGGEITVTTLSKDFQSIVKTDASGTPITDLALGRDLKDWTSFSAMIPFDSAGVTSFWIRNWSQLEIPFYAAFTAGGEPTWVAFYNSGNIRGYLSGLRGGAEYELLSGFKAAGIKSMDLQSLTHLYALVVMIVGNIVLFGVGKKR